MTALECLEKLVDNKIETIGRKNKIVINNWYYNSITFGEYCSVNYHDHKEEIVNLIVQYMDIKFEQDIKKESEEHVKLVLLLSKINKYITNRNEQAILNFIKS